MKFGGIFAAALASFVSAFPAERSASTQDITIGELFEGCATMVDLARNLTRQNSYPHEFYYYFKYGFKYCLLNFYFCILYTDSN